MTEVHAAPAPEHHDHNGDDHHHHHHDEHGHHHDHDHEHHHDHNHEHHHDHQPGGLLASIAAALHLPGYGHTHDHGDIVQSISAADNALAVRTVWLALLALAVTTVLQIIIFLASGSVALLADTVHNLGDALNSVPLLIAFYLARRPPNRRYTYGYHRAEDVAGIFIVISIGFSAAYILWESVQKLINPQPLDNLGWVAAAAVVGFIGNELVALLQIRVGRKIGSEAMVADGLHARTDGLTSLAVLIAAGGAAVGVPILDPIIGILIGIAIVFITRDAALAIWYRLMDAVDPKLTAAVEAVIREHPEARAIHRLQLRWLGHQLYAEIVVELDAQLSLVDSEAIIDHLRHHLHHQLPRLSKATISALPWHPTQSIHGQESQHHRAQAETV